MASAVGCIVLCRYCCVEVLCSFVKKFVRYAVAYEVERISDATDDHMIACHGRSQRWVIFVNPRHHGFLPKVESAGAVDWGNAI